MYILNIWNLILIYQALKFKSLLEKPKSPITCNLILSPENTISTSKYVVITGGESNKYIYYCLKGQIQK